MTIHPLRCSIDREAPKSHRSAEGGPTSDFPGRYGANTAAIQTTLPKAALGEFDAIKASPGMVSATADTLRKTWCAGVDLQRGPTINLAFAPLPPCKPQFWRRCHRRRRSGQRADAARDHRCVARALALPEVAACRARLVPEVPVYGATSTRADEQVAAASPMQ